MKSQPPKVFLRFFQWYAHPDLKNHIEGDLMELYRERVEKSGKTKADVKFIIDVLLLFRPGIIRPTEGHQNLNTYGMYKSYLKLGWRSLLRSKGYSLINISGLAIGMAVTMLIGLWVFDELSFNKSFKNYDRIAKLHHHLTFGDKIYTADGSPQPMSDELKTNYAEFDNAALSSEQAEHILGYGNKKFSTPGLFVEPAFLDMFSVHIVQGTTALKNIHSIVLSKTLAGDLVGDNPVGKIIKFDNRDNLIITGVFENFPSNSRFAEIKMLLPLDYYFTMSEAAQKQLNNWEALDFQCFVLLNDKASFPEAELKIKNILFEKGSVAMKAIKPDGLLLPMEKWHLRSEFKEGKNIGGKIQFVWMFGTIAAFVLLLACINFMNLSTARSEKRSKEVGIRKVMGSARNQLVNQFLTESFLVVIIAFLMSILLVVLCLPQFNELAGKKMLIPWNNSYFLVISITFIMTTSILAGSYPALYLSSFNPIKVLKGTFKAGRLAVIPRKVMVIFQFTISIALTIGTIIVFQQIQHAKNRPVGFDRDGIFSVNVRTQELSKANYNTLRNDLLGTGAIDNMAKSDFPITGGASVDASLTWSGKDPSFRPLIAMNSCSHDFPKTNGFQFIEGRDFSREFSTDSTAAIINETAAKLFSDKSAIGMKIKGSSGNEREIIGVIKDQVRSTPFSKQWPHVYYIDYTGMGYLTIRIKTDVGIHSALDKIEAVLRKHDPGAPFEYKFVDDDYARLFNDEERIGKLASVFASLAIFISCLGIFGLASFSASQRTKEIGIRKVLGASIFNVWKMLSRDFVSLIIGSILLAIPLAYYFSNRWLEQYEYRTEISWLVFTLTAVGALIIMLFTVSYQSVKAAMANPVDSLRSE
jgi:putative ABC transport system permease protein